MLSRVILSKPGYSSVHEYVRAWIFIHFPVSGVVKEVRRGEQRKLLEVVVEKSGDEYIDFGKRSKAEDRKRRDYKEAASGLYSVRQRPYHIIANPADKPKSVFISGF
ncbi:MAG: hypothetical protein MZV64_35780 [Ignavibacteriales bacterium]|nr:hypothetical protein [Ignavibacteriales bacterium]